MHDGSLRPGDYQLSTSMVLRRQLRELVRERLAAGVLPPEHPELPDRSGPSPMSEVRVGTVSNARCTLCGNAGPHTSYRYLDGRVLRLHAACDMAWREEAGERQRRRAAPPRPQPKPKARDAFGEPR